MSKSEELITMESATFPTQCVQLTPSALKENKIIYCTRYEQSSGFDQKANNSTGIIEYDINKKSHKLLASYNRIQYYPRWNAMTFSRIRNILFSVGGVNVKKGNKDYNIIATFNLKSSKVSTIPLNVIIGSNPKIILTNNDEHLHILGGEESGKHMLFNLTTNKLKTIEDFSNKNPSISEQGVLFNKTKNQLYMFGGINSKKTSQMYRDFWICDIGNNHRWKQNASLMLPLHLRAFGSVLYDDRVIIVFGGEGKSGYQDSIRYLDLNGFTWKKSKLKLPQSGKYHAVLMDSGDVHILPFYTNKNHYTINVCKILPKSLIKTIVMRDDTKEDDNKDEKKAEEKLDQVLEDLEDEMNGFKTKYNEQKLQETMKRSPKELVEPASTMNINIKKYEEKLERILQATKSFAKHVEETKSRIEVLSVPNIEEYKTWTLDQIMIWIMSLDGGKFQEYENKLRNGFVKSKISKGDVLTELDRSDLSSSPFNIDEFVIKKQLINHFQSLKREQADIDDVNLNEGMVTEYH